MTAALPARLSLPVSSIAPALARAGLRTTFERLPDATCADLYLLTTEVVANAVRHSRMGPLDDIDVVATVGDRSVRVEVTDTGVGFDPASVTPSGESGWGLRLVQRLASRWGVERRPNCTTVWFELEPNG